MTSSVRILTTASLDSTPSLVLIAPNGDKILVNCGEGCQRAFLESTGLKLKSVKRICLTRLHPSAIGGLPGLLLTLADATENSNLAEVLIQQDKLKKDKLSGHDLARKKREWNSAPVGRQSEGEIEDPRKSDVKYQQGELSGGIEIHGPLGTLAFVHSLRHFMRRDRFEFAVREGAQEYPLGFVKERKQKKPKKSSLGSDSFFDYTIHALEFQHRLDEGTTVPIQSFIFQTPPLVGRFQPDKAAELGIPKGPMFSQLKSGFSVTFNKDGNEITIQPHQVLEDGHPGLVVVVVYCPTLHVLRQLKICELLQQYQQSQKSQVSLDLMIHIAPRAIVADEYKAWVQLFPSYTSHIWMDDNEVRTTDHNWTRSPFVAASLGGLMRSMINTDIYPSPLQEDVQETVPGLVGPIIEAKRHMEYVLTPRLKKGIINLEAMSEKWNEKIDEAKLFVEASGAKEAARDFALPSLPFADSSFGEILFAGTGSALPCKHRNVTGICLTLASNQRILLDCGEGTVGQLLRSCKSQALRDSLLESIQAVWISHPHADHHLGILRLLSERRTGEPVMLIAPPNLYEFMTEYEVIDPSVEGSYRWLNCYDLVTPCPPDSPLSRGLESRLGITSILAVPVSHCRHAFAVVLDTPKDILGRVAYSGDCRPSPKFADLALHADILIHEATFEDGMEEEAVLKKHCTVGEAISVAARMKAKTVLLTHFSQRYPKMPVLKQSDESDSQSRGMSVVFCFDFMKLTPATIPHAAKLTEAMRLLYPDPPEKKSDCDTNHEVNAKSIISIPGLFARSELL